MNYDTPPYYLVCILFLFVKLEYEVFENTERLLLCFGVENEVEGMLALGLDSMEMLRMETNLKPNSVRTYCTQVKTALSDILQNKVERV